MKSSRAATSLSYRRCREGQATRQRSEKLLTEEGLRLVVGWYHRVHTRGGAGLWHISSTKAGSDESLTGSGGGTRIFVACTSAIGCICTLQRPSRTKTAARKFSTGAKNSIAEAASTKTISVPSTIRMVALLQYSLSLSLRVSAPRCAVRLVQILLVRSAQMHLFM